MTTRIIPIPSELMHLLDAIFIEREKLLIIHLGEKYSNKKAIGTISFDFTKFKKIIEKSLKSKDMDRNDIDQIISLIENNYEIIYSDIESDVELSSKEPLEDDINGTKESQIQKSDITFEKWQETLKEKYYAIKETCNKNFHGMWHSLEFELSVLKILNIKGCTLPFAGIVLGAPSSSKTLGIELFREYKNVYYSDSFTPKAFVSHSTSVSKEEL